MDRQKLYNYLLDLRSTIWCSTKKRGVGATLIFPGGQCALENSIEKRVARAGAGSESAAGSAAQRPNPADLAQIRPRPGDRLQRDDYGGNG